MNSRPPPAEAYSRVSNPDLFLPLPAIVLELIDRLEERFEVRRELGVGLDPALERSMAVLPTVRLTPAPSTAAPITVAFLRGPSIFIRCGRWTELGFPTCSCDACDATVEGEAHQLSEIFQGICSGGFREEFVLPFIGSAWRSWSIRTAGHLQGGGGRISRREARKLIGTGPRRWEWEPWRRR